LENYCRQRLCPLKPIAMYSIIFWRSHSSQVG
jgi:hypothetical protein